MPANSENETGQAADSQPSASPEPAQLTDRSPESAVSVKRMRLPPIVDFTGFRPDGVQHVTSDPAAYRDLGGTRRSPVASSTSHHPSPSQVSGHSAGGAPRIDPALHTQGPPSSSTTHAATVQDEEQRKHDRRATLMREAELMRAALRAKEREIDELER